MINGIDRHIEANVSGGFEGWLKQLEDFDSDVIAVGETRGIHTEKLWAWLKTRYREERIGPWAIYVKK